MQQLVATSYLHYLVLGHHEVVVHAYSLHTV